MPRTPTSTLRAFSGAKAEYAAMQDSRFRRRRPGVSSAGGGADVHFANEARFIHAREYARAMERDDAVIGFLVDRAVTNLVGGGFQLEPQTGDTDLDRELADLWWAWAIDPLACDIERDRSFMEMEAIVAARELIDGDIFAVGTDEGSLQFFEADRCRTPTNSRKNIVHGVELGPRRERLAYYFTKQETDPFRKITRVSDAPRMPAFDDEGYRQVFHVCRPTRFSQTRGMTALAPIFDKAGMFEDIDFALLVKEQMAAALAWEEQTDVSAQDGPGVTYGSRDTQTRPDGGTDVLEEIGPGSIVRPPPGKKLAMHSPQIPSHETMAHLRMTLQVISLNLGLPLCVALLDASETNFSGWRGAMDQAKLGFQRNQERLELRFHRQVYTWRLRAWIAEGKIPRATVARLQEAGKLFDHKWNKPRWPYVQPLQDAQADTLRIESYLAGAKSVIMERGRDPDEVIRETISFNAACIAEAVKAARQIEQATNEKIHWRDVYNRSVPKGGQVFDSLDTENDQKAQGSAQPAGKGS